jgi:hypothetical protein
MTRPRRRAPATSASSRAAGEGQGGRRQVVAARRPVPAGDAERLRLERRAQRLRAAIAELRSRQLPSADDASRQALADALGDFGRQLAAAQACLRALEPARKGSARLSREHHR